MTSAEVVIICHAQIGRVNLRSESSLVVIICPDQSQPATKIKTININQPNLCRIFFGIWVDYELNYQAEFRAADFILVAKVRTLFG